MYREILIPAIFMNSIILIVGTLSSVYVNSRAYLTSRGYSEEYIEAKKKFGIKINIIQLFLIILTQASLILIIGKVKTGLTSDDYMHLVIPGAILVLLPVTVALSTRFNNKYKHLAETTGENVVLDFNFSLLKKFMDLRFEVPFTFIFLIISYFSFGTDGFTTILYSTLIPWVFYFSTKFSKNMNTASFKESYALMFQFTNVYAVLLTFLTITFSMHNFFEGYSVKLILSVCCITLIVSKAIIIFIKYPILKRELNNIDIKQ